MESNYQKVVTVFKKVLKHKKLNASCKRRIHNQIVKLKTFHALLTQKTLSTRGAGHSSTTNVLRSSVEWQDVESAFKNRLITGVLVNLTKRALINFLDNSKQIIFQKISDIIKNCKQIKVNHTLAATFVLHETTEQKYFHTVNQILQGMTDLNEWYDDVCSVLQTKIEEFQERDSGWALKTIDSLLVNINKHTSMLGYSYIKLPLDIHKKNMQLLMFKIMMMHVLRGRVFPRLFPWEKIHKELTIILLTSLFLILIEYLFLLQ